ncbi:MAG TPA: Gmad2 immunoglobulin-like domain-containing protein [Ktedonobacteraceae bacterium]|nr:Gmad2 immunoglobulin-like domain-containing protein [Ktedonobacteraceae bacterium]
MQEIGNGTDDEVSGVLGVGMQKHFLSSSQCLCLTLLLSLIYTLAACNSNNAADSGVRNTSTPKVQSTATMNAGTPTTDTGNSSAPATPTNAQSGVQPCPPAVSDSSYWDPIVLAQSGVSQVGRVSCAHLINSSSLQALILVGYSGTGHIVDVYVYNNITDPKPQQLFKLQGLYKGDAKISGYNTILTAEVDQDSKVNKGQPNAALTVDLFREFKWSDGAGTFVPVSFPGIFPDLTRYQAEGDQQQVNQGHQPWKLDAGLTANALAVALLHWPTNAQTTIVKGGRQHDLNATVTVKSPSPGGKTIMVTLSRLEGNADQGIWEVTDVEAAGMSITAPHNGDQLSSPVMVTGTGSAFEGNIGRVVVLDHLYNDIGHAEAMGAIGNGPTQFAMTVSYSVSFKTGAQEGIVALYAYSNADGSIAGAVMLKVLLS